MMSPLVIQKRSIGSCNFVLQIPEDNCCSILVTLTFCKSHICYGTQQVKMLFVDLSARSLLTQELPYGIVFQSLLDVPFMQMTPLHRYSRIGLKKHAYVIPPLPLLVLSFPVHNSTDKHKEPLAMIRSHAIVRLAHSRPFHSLSMFVLCVVLLLWLTLMLMVAFLRLDQVQLYCHLYMYKYRVTKCGQHGGLHEY